MATTPPAVEGMHVAGAETGTHTLTRWHAEITVYVPAPGGGSRYQNYSCTHDHTSRAGAQECEDRMRRLAYRVGFAIIDQEWVKLR